MRRSIPVNLFQAAGWWSACSAKQSLSRQTATIPISVASPSAPPPPHVVQGGDDHVDTNNVTWALHGPNRTAQGRWAIVHVHKPVHDDDVSPAVLPYRPGGQP